MLETPFSATAMPTLQLTLIFLDMVSKRMM